MQTKRPTNLLLIYAGAIVILLSGAIVFSSFAINRTINAGFADGPAVRDILFPARQVSMSGFTGEKLNQDYYNRVLAQDVDTLIAPFRKRTETSCWQTEFWGKWFTSAVLAYNYQPTPALKARLDKAVAGLLSTQTADGYIGNYTPEKELEQWDIWGRKYCILGLLAYNDLTGDAKSLQAARREADYLIKELADKKVLIVQKGNHRGMAASSVLEPMVLLYNHTKDKRYLDFAEEIVRQWELPVGPQLISKSTVDVGKRFPKPDSWFGWGQGQKAYEMMSCYEGLLELYRVTGNATYKEAVEKTWENINKTEINIAGSGAAVECWFGGKFLQTRPITHYQETCVTATWIKLSQQLLRLTGESKYADAIEETFYNALLGSMKPDGSGWTKYTPLAGKRQEGDEQCHMGLNCCTASGPRGLFTLPLTVVMQDNEGLRINFFTEGNYKLMTPAGQPVQVTQQTDYPASGNINVSMSLAKAEEFTVRMRIPAYSKQTTLTVNGEQIKDLVPGTYALIKRKWQAGDKISLQTDMRGRVVQSPGQTGFTAIVRGPVVLTRDARLAGPQIDEVITPIADKEGYIQLEPVTAAAKNIWMQFSCHFMGESTNSGGEPVTAVLCDYASAGNTYNDSSLFRVWLPQLYDPRK